MDNVISFEQNTISSSILSKMEDAAFSAFAFDSQRPFFFLHIRNQDLIAEFEELGDCKGETKGAPAVTAVFFDPKTAAAEIDASIALGAFNAAGLRENLSFVYLPSFRLLLNDPRHKELLRLCGVPADYFCIAAEALGKAQKTEAVSVTVNHNRSAYVQ